MPRSSLSVQTISRSGLNPSYTAANVDGHSVANQNEDVVLHVKNGSAAAVTVTFVTSSQVLGLDVADLTVSVPASGERIVGRFPTGTFNQTDGTVHVDFSAVTSVTVAALR